jgi:prevent-host-death family protein
MIHIHPVSDLRNKFPQIEAVVHSGQPVYLTKNGRGSMVVLSLEDYAHLTDASERALDEADRAAARSDLRLTHSEVFGALRSGL